MDIEAEHSNEQSFEQPDTQKCALTVLGIALDFDWVTKDSNKSRADEIRLLTVKNSKQPKKSKERKPPGIGCPAGGVESGEELDRAVLRETRRESGYGVGGKVLGEIYYEDRPKIPNRVHVFLIEVDSSYVVSVEEKDEVDPTWDNWVTLRDFFNMPYAISPDGKSLNPSGIYYGHARRVVKALNMLILNPEEDLPVKADAWAEEHYNDLVSAMTDLRRDGLVSLSENGWLSLPE